MSLPPSGAANRCISPLSFLDTTSTAPSSSTKKKKRSTKLKENPFADEEEEDDVSVIEAELQELGGQMVGSILDF